MQADDGIKKYGAEAVGACQVVEGAHEGCEEGVTCKLHSQSMII